MIIVTEDVMVSQLDMNDEDSKRKIFQVPDFIGFACRQLGMSTRTWALVSCLLIIIVQVFVKRKILSIKNILSAYTRKRTEAPAHMNILTIQT